MFLQHQVTCSNVTLLAELLLDVLSNSLLQMLIQLRLDAFKHGSVNVSAANLWVGVDVIFCGGLVVVFFLIL
jgi:hypothetical protein